MIQSFPYAWQYSHVLPLILSDRFVRLLTDHSFIHSSANCFPRASDEYSSQTQVLEQICEPMDGIIGSVVQYWFRIRRASSPWRLTNVPAVAGILNCFSRVWVVLHQSTKLSLLYFTDITEADFNISVGLERKSWWLRGRSEWWLTKRRRYWKKITTMSFKMLSIIQHRNTRTRSY